MNRMYISLHSEFFRIMFSAGMKETNCRIVPIHVNSKTDEIYCRVKGFLF